MKKLIISTGNQDKVKEIEAILHGLPFEAMSKGDAGLAYLEVEEDEPTLMANAQKKAQALREHAQNAVVLADDTGLYVDALNGEPGIYTARYAGENCSYADNRKKLLEQLEGVPECERTARFITSIVIIDTVDRVYHAEGICEGLISTCERGELGFGYDSIFIPAGFNRTFAEMTSEEKNRISHRALALVELRSILEELSV